MADVPSLPDEQEGAVTADDLAGLLLLVVCLLVVLADGGRKG